MNDVFISYRRDTGSKEASLINEKLKARGVRPFLDKHNIHSEDFFQSIRRHIDSSPNFLMILTPGYFTKRNGEDWVRKEIEYAWQKKKRFIGIAFDEYDHGENDWNSEDEIIRQFKTFNYFPFNDTTSKHEDASIDAIIDNMVDAQGRKFSVERHLSNNAWYLNHEMTDEDMLWIISDHDVCKNLDWKILDKALGESVFAGREDLSMFVLKAYDIETYEDKYSLGPKRKNDRAISQVFGFTYESFVDHANERFGEGHFCADPFSDGNSPKDNDAAVDKAIKKILRDNDLPGFDLMDFTLIIKDRDNPENTVSQMTRYLNPKGGIIYIRELDDDFIQAFPDEKQLIPRMKKLLEMDIGAGNRHTGKKIYTYLKKAGANKVFISNEVISTANLSKTSSRERICDTYFSYLIPEMEMLVKEHPDNDDYTEGLDWLRKNYPLVQSLFRSTEFYFRTGHIAGYGVFSEEEDDE